LNLEGQLNFVPDRFQAPNAMDKGDCAGYGKILICQREKPSPKTKPVWRDLRPMRWGGLVVLLRIQGLGFKDPTLWPFIEGERKSGSSRQGLESLLPGKRHPKLPEISQIWATIGTTNFLAVCSAFLRVFPFGVKRDYCNGSFLWNLGIRIR
jgi:hypothetical protein